MVKIDISEKTLKLLDKFKLSPLESYDDVLWRILKTELEQKESSIHYRAKKLLCDRLWEDSVFLIEEKSFLQEERFSTICDHAILGWSDFYTIEYPFYCFEKSNHFITNYYDEGFCPAFEICKKRAEKLGLEHPPCREICKYRSKETNVAYMVEKFVGIKPVVIADIAFGRKGIIELVFEIIYKHPLNKYKRNLYLENGLTVVEIRARDIFKHSGSEWDPIPCKIYSKYEGDNPLGLCKIKR